MERLVIFSDFTVRIWEFLLGGREFFIEGGV